MKTKITNETAAQAQHTGFGVNDNKGRELGIIVRFWECDFVALPEDVKYGWEQEPGHWFVANVQTARAGKSYGASQRSNYFKTRMERDVYLAQRMGRGLKDALKKSA
jgi:hypothetical protein